MVVFPNAKINLGLSIIEKRPDGYHNIESCFYPIPITDALEVIESDTPTFYSSGIKIPGNPKENLCLKAYHLLRSIYELPPLAIHLYKNIPIGAGLGGGSSNGAFMIKLLNDKFSLGITTEKQEKLAGKLGSDCPFFIRSRPAFIEGRGTIFSKIDVSLKGYYLALVLPNIHVSTAEAYSKIVPQKTNFNLKKDLESLSISSFQNKVKNDFEVSIFKQYPKLAKIKEQLVQYGALYTSLSGSGSAIFGIFEKRPNIDLGEAVEVIQLN